MEVFTLKKLLIITTAFIFSFFALIPQSAEAAGRVWVDLGAGYKAGFDEPHDPKTGKWHVHIYKGSKEIASENMDGTPHDGSTLKKAPKSVVKKLKEKKEYDKYKKKQDKLKKARADVKKFSWKELLFDPTPIFALAVGLGVTFYTFSMVKWKSIIS